jgi:Domain of unknown function (DUF6265)
MKLSMATAALAVLAVASLGEEPPVGSLAELAWMAGAWSSGSPDVHSEELWTEPRGGVMLGLHRDVRAGRSASWEYLRIEEGPEGIVYQASPGGAAPTPFRLVELEASRAVFSNPEHDFPKRIVYWLAEGGTLLARADAGPGTEGPEWAWQPSP